MATKSKNEEVIEQPEQIQDWFHTELPDVDLSDEAIAERVEDIQDWVTAEYGVIAILDEAVGLFEALRATTKTRIDLLSAMARTVERLQAEIQEEQ